MLELLLEPRARINEGKWPEKPELGKIRLSNLKAVVISAKTIVPPKFGVQENQYEIMAYPIYENAVYALHGIGSEQSVPIKIGQSHVGEGMRAGVRRKNIQNKNLEAFTDLVTPIQFRAALIYYHVRYRVALGDINIIQVSRESVIKI